MNFIQVLQNQIKGLLAEWKTSKLREVLKAAEMNCQLAVCLLKYNWMLS